MKRVHQYNALPSAHPFAPPGSSEVASVVDPPVTDASEWLFPTVFHEPNSWKPDSSPAYKIFCTWRNCTKTFRYKFDWARHEEAKHYCPYHWVCCLDDESCSSTNMSFCIICEEVDVSFSMSKKIGISKVVSAKKLDHVHSFAGTI